MNLTLRITMFAHREEQPLSTADHGLPIFGESLKLRKQNILADFGNHFWQSFLVRTVYVRSLGWENTTQRLQDIDNLRLKNIKL